MIRFDDALLTLALAAKVASIPAAGYLAFMAWQKFAGFERLGNTVTHDSSPLLLTQQGPDTTWERSKQFWPPGNVANPEGAQDFASPACAALDCQQFDPYVQQILDDAQSESDGAAIAWIVLMVVVGLVLAGIWWMRGGRV